MTELCDRLRGICGLRNQNHVRLRANDGAQALVENWMIFDAKDANRPKSSHRNPHSMLLGIVLDSGLLTQDSKRREAMIVFGIVLR